MKKVLFLIIGLVVVTVFAGGSYLKFRLPNVGKAPERVVEQTPERIQRGQYLAMHVAACMDCHSTRDWSRYSGPLTAGTLGKGGEYFGPEMGFPGKFYSKNLTPAHLGEWTDGEIFRAITSGVDKNGKALFPVMPYPYYAKMDPDDIWDIIAYIRSLAPIENDVPSSEANFPMNFIINTIPDKPSFGTKPDTNDRIAYGQYLVNTAACMDCHTPVKGGQIMIEKAFSGGRVFEMPGGTLRSANITPDQATGIGAWSDSVFVNRFKAFERIDALHPVKEGTSNTLMPWSMYAGMSRHDLEAIYAYLQSLPPVKNEVVKFSPK